MIVEFIIQNMIGERVRAMRIAAGMNMSQLARACKMSQPSIFNIESGKTKSVKGDTILSLARALNVSAEWLNTGKGLPTKSCAPSSMCETELIEICKALNETNKIALLATARALFGTQNEPPSVIDPYPYAPTPSVKPRRPAKTEN